jgi:hypothetical protein
VQSVGIDRVRLVVLSVEWPDTPILAYLGQIDFGPPVWSGSAPPPSFTVCEGCWTGLPSYRELDQYETKTLTFHLSRDLDDLNTGYYTISATFRNLTNDETCSASISVEH